MEVQWQKNFNWPIVVWPAGEAKSTKVLLRRCPKEPQATSLEAYTSGMILLTKGLSTLSNEGFGFGATRKYSEQQSEAAMSSISATQRLNV